MFIIRTNIGNFNSHADLYKFMKDESVDSVKVLSAEYCLTKLPVLQSNYTLEEVEKASRYELETV